MQRRATECELTAQPGARKPHKRIVPIQESGYLWSTVDPNKRRLRQKVIRPSVQILKRFFCPVYREN